MRSPASPPSPATETPGAGARVEFSRPVRVSDLDARGVTVAHKADAQERAALARRFDVGAVGKMSYEAEIRPAGEGWRVSGTVRARVTQSCVVTLEDVAQEIEEPFSRLFLPDARPAGLADIDPDEQEDPPEPLGTRLDPAEIATEAVALAIDPYPRAPGARFDGVADAGEAAPEGGETRRPFSALAALREKMDRDDEG